MIKFRHHRATLYESMKTVIEVNSIADIANEIDEEINAEEGQQIIKLSHIGFDKRIGWETYNVSVKINNEWCAIGMTNGNFN